MLVYELERWWLWGLLHGWVSLLDLPSRSYNYRLSPKAKDFKSPRRDFYLHLLDFNSHRPDIKWIHPDFNSHLPGF
jgi:hypothetical protein